MPEKNKVHSEDFPLTEVEQSARKGFVSISSVLLGFTFFTATMWAGGSIGTSFTFPKLLEVIVAGNAMLAVYVAILGYIAFKSGLNSVLMTRFCFGNFGSKFSDFLLGFTQIGWYAWGTATISIILANILKLPEYSDIPLMIFFGFSFCWTAYVGYKGLEILSWVAVPAMTVVIIWSFILTTGHLGGIENLLKITPKDSIQYSVAITLVFGTFASGGTQATNWTRFAKSAKTAVLASLLAFFAGNGLMIFAGAYGAIVYQDSDIVSVLIKQGLLLCGIIMLFLNIWTTQDNTIYNFSTAGCNLIRTNNRKKVTLIGAALGTILAICGMYNFLVPYLVILGNIIPPIGGVIMVDFFYKQKGKYPKLSDAKIPSINIPGTGAYIIGSLMAFFSSGIAPINGIAASIISYIIIDKAVLNIRNLKDKSEAIPKEQI